MSKIKYLVMDVDGTLTDGKIYMGNKGELFKAFDVKDGCGIHDILIPSGIQPIIITGRTSEILEKRCQELGILNIFQGINNKVEQLNQLLQANGDTYDHVAYIGDDINDIPCMEVVKKAGGFVGCPSNGVKEVKILADFVSLQSGGNGAVREFIEWIVQNK